jgi:hypothetical protein
VPDRYLYGFMHIPKTGGSTINRQLRNHLGGEEFAHFRRRGKRPRANVEMFPDLPLWKRKKTRVVAGHYLQNDVHELVPGSIPRYFTIVRDPADRVLSVYNFRRHKGEADRLPFVDWLEEYKTDVAFNLVCFYHHIPYDAPRIDKRVKTALGGMWFVGVTEHLNDDLPHLFRHLGVPGEWTNQRMATTDDSQLEAARALPKADRWKEANPVRQRIEMTPEIRREIHRRNPRDLALYKWARKMRKKKLSALRSE